MENIRGLRVHVRNDCSGSRRYEADYIVEFLAHDGAKVKAPIIRSVGDRVIHHGARLLRIEVITAFRCMSHIRLPHGEHVHVSNGQLMHWPLFDSAAA